MSTMTLSTFGSKVSVNQGFQANPSTVTLNRRGRLARTCVVLSLAIVMASVVSAKAGLAQALPLWQPDPSSLSPSPLARPSGHWPIDSQAAQMCARSSPRSSRSTPWPQSTFQPARSCASRSSSRDTKLILASSCRVSRNTL